MIEALLRNRANKLQAYFVNICVDAHGEIGSTTFLRCLACHHIVTANKILLDGKCWCSAKRFKETNLTIAEELYWIGRAIIWKTLKKS